jgi:nitroreductase
VAGPGVETCGRAAPCYSGPARRSRSLAARMAKPAPTELPLLDPIAQRWSPRAFSERAPTDDELALVFEAARWAPSCFNDQPWRFLVVRRDEPEFADAVAGLVAQNQAWAQHAPVLGFSLARQSFAHNGQPNRHAWYDLGAAMALLSIQAASLGLMVHQMAGIVGDVVRERFAVPEELDVAVGFALGWPGDPEALAEPYKTRELAERSRIGLEEVLLRGRFGAR